MVDALRELDFLGRNVKVDFATEEQMARGISERSEGGQRGGEKTGYPNVQTTHKATAKNTLITTKTGQTPTEKAKETALAVGATITANAAIAATAATEKKTAPAAAVPATDTRASVINQPFRGHDLPLTTP